MAQNSYRSRLAMHPLQMVYLCKNLITKNLHL
nr:MAG TPA: hypothetical protein [Caudoviricetes sp.]